jgi:hypothetical protein
MVFNKTGTNSLLNKECFKLFGEIAEEVIERSQREFNGTNLAINKT